MDANNLYRLLVSVFGEQYITRKKQFRINCIQPHCGDQSGNLEINLDKGICHCWRCGYSGTVRQLFWDYLGYIPDIRDELRTIEDFDREEPEFTEIKYVELPKEFRPLWKPPESLIGKMAFRYASNRMSMDEIEKYYVGYCGIGKYARRIIVPTFENGRVVYFVARAIFPNPKRYDNPTKEEGYAGTNEIVFNIDRARVLNRAVLCEGVFDAIKVGEDGVALFGSDISGAQLMKLYDISRIYVMLDSPQKDPNSIKNAIKIADEFREHRHPGIYLVVLPSGDPGSNSREDLRRLIDGVKLYTEGERFNLI